MICNNMELVLYMKINQKIRYLIVNIEIQASDGE